MEQNENKIIIIDEEGRERVCEILFTYQNPDTLKNYVVLYPIDELDSDDADEEDFDAARNDEDFDDSTEEDLKDLVIIDEDELELEE